jgi:uncharacterized membrane protein YhiD involved in acid resistance
LWVVAAIGMAVGAAAYAEAVTATLLVMLALMLLGRFEDHLIPRRSADRTFRLVLGSDPALVSELERLLAGAGLRVGLLEVEKQEDAVVASFEVQGDVAAYDATLRMLLEQPGVRRVSMT